MVNQQLRLTSSIQSLLAGYISSITGVPEQLIDLDESFTSLGGDSVAAVALVSLCKRAGIHLNTSTVLLSESIRDIIVTACSGISRGQKLIDQTTLSRRIVCEKRHQHSITADSTSRKRKLDVLLNEDDRRTANQDLECSTSCADRAEEVEEPLTEMQSLLFQSRDSEDISNVITYTETYSLSDFAAVKAAWEQTIAQEPHLRRSVIVDSKNLSVVSTCDATLQWEEIETDSYEDLKYLSQLDSTSSIANVRFRVIKLDRGLHREGIATVIWQAHHALIDGHAAALIYGKFQDVLNGRPTKPGYPFSLVARQLRVLQEQRATEAQLFWKQRKRLFQVAASDLKLPNPIFNPRRRLGSTGKVVVQSPSVEINAIACQLNCTLASMYTAAWSLVLSRYLCSDCVLFGVVMSGRSLPIMGIEDTVGPLINTLPLCVRLQPDEPLSNLIGVVFKELALLSDVEFSRASDGFERSFSSVIAMQFDMEPSSSSIVRPLQKAELRVSSEVPLSICIDKRGEIQLFYQDAIFKESDMMLISEHFKRTLELMLNPSITVNSCLDMFLTNECQQSLALATNRHVSTNRAGSRDDTLVSLFQQCVHENAQRIAIVKDDIHVSYSSLQQYVLHVANRLSQFVNPGDTVCILADRSINWIIGIYAILTLGGVYVPLNPVSCSESRETNFSECCSQVFLVPYSNQYHYSPATCRTMFSIESILSQVIKEIDTDTGRRKIAPESAAYICFTSGSTGDRPKAVLCTHEGLVAFQSQLEVRLMAEPGTRISQMMSPVFDGSIHEIFSALSYGATLVLPPSAGDIIEHLSLVDSTIMTPSLAAALDSKAYPYLRTVYLVGEVVPQQVCDTWAVHHRLYNMYGPTEATCGATITRLFPHQPVTIGKPNMTSRVYILDPNKRQTPPGVIGEIYLAGVQVARGYLGRREETQESFLQDTICPDSGEKMYRTGDFGYWSSVGDIVYVGRRDRQIKLRGFRLDLNNLESRIARAVSDVRGVAVTHKQGQLIAMLQSSTKSIEEIRPLLESSLEPQFVPHHVIIVDEFPLNLAGKIDYAKIADRVSTKTTHEPSELVTATESRLLKLWEELLDITDAKNIDVSSNFLSLGGHSVKQLVLLGHIEKTLGCHLKRRTVLDLLASGTLRDLARLIDIHPLVLSSNRSPEGTSDRCVITERAISGMEMQWWHLYQKADETSQFNVSLAWKLTPDKVDILRLTDAWNAVLARHDILRSRYVSSNSRVERVHTLCPPTVSRVDWIDMDRECNRPFDLQEDFLIRVAISSDQLLVCASHIILDLTAAQTMLAEVGSVYAGNTLPQVPPLYAATLKHLESLSPPDAAFWSANLANVVNARRERLATHCVKSFQGSSLLLRLGSDVLRDLGSVAHQHRTTKHQIGLAAVSVALSTNTEHLEPDLLVGAPWSNRDTANYDVVGLFLEILPIVLSRQHDDTPLDSLFRKVQQSSQNSLAHAVPWSNICELLDIQLREGGADSSTSTLMLLDAMVTFHEHGQSIIDIDGMSPIMTWSQGSKFRIMFEFSECENGELMLRVEYNSAIYSYAQALSLARQVCGALGKFGCATIAGEELLLDQASVLFGKDLD